MKKYKQLKKAKQDFVNLGIMEAMAAVKCGFELETQAVDGRTLRDIAREENEAENSIDYDAFGNHCYELAGDMLEHINTAAALAVYRNEAASPHYLGGHIKLAYRDLISGDETSVAYQILNLIRLYDIARQNGQITADASSSALYTALEPDITSYGTFKISRVFKDLHAANIETPIEGFAMLRDMTSEALFDLVDISEFTTSAADDVDTDNIDSESIKTPSGVTWKSDGSVTGPEFITEGRGTTAGLFASSLKQLFNMHSFEIDEGCSFHIHISVPGIKHSYGRLFQAYLMEYLLTNVNRVPQSVKTRWKASTSYFKPKISEDKYSFVHFHAELRTWEFRCFGNIHNALDGLKCLKLAVEALQYAYRVQLGQATSLVWSEDEWKERTFVDVIELSKSFPVAFKAHRPDRTTDESLTAA